MMEHIFEQALLNSRILIAEDDLVGRRTLMQVFQKQGFSNIEAVGDGQAAWERALANPPDLIITDIRMPRVDGFELCRRIRAHPDPRISQLPVLVQTALTEPSEKAAIFSAGASDYVSKPIDLREIAARANVHLERELMTRKLREFNERFRNELDTAKSTQHFLIPSSVQIQEIEEQHRLKLHGHFQLCTELGGDFWGVRSISGHEFAIYTVDFSGHGVNAALNVFRLHALMYSAISTAHSPPGYLMHLNAILAPLLPAGQFATMFYGVVDTRKNTLRYASAGAPPPILLHSGGYDVLESSGMLLGIDECSSYEIRQMPFHPGDCLLLYSDALVETPSEDKETLSSEEIAQYFRHAGASPAGDYGPAVARLLEDFTLRRAARLNDDLTFVACHRL